MEKIKVLFTAEAENSLVTSLEDICDITFEGWNQKKPVIKDDQTLIDLLKGKEVFVTSYDYVTEKVIENSPNLKFIICTRSTPANIDLKSVKAHGIPLSNTPGRNSDTTAEFAAGLILDISKNITRANRAIMNGSIVTDDLEKPDIKKSDMTWPTVKGISPYSEFKGMQIKNKNIGIVGYGNIGKRVAKIFIGFDANILIFDPFVSSTEIDSPSMKKVTFDELLEKSDFITCHTKITESTRGMFNYEAFCKMKSTAFFINNSRGAVTVESDLIRALEEKIIGGAALDVFEYEPLYKGHPFLSGKFDNLLITPHISGASADAIVNGTKMLVEEIRKYANKEPLIYQIKL